jgi:hypothetical protein
MRVTVGTVQQRQNENYDKPPQYSRTGSRRDGIYGWLSEVVRFSKMMIDLQNNYYTYYLF